MPHNPRLEKVEKSFERIEPRAIGFVVGCDIGRQHDYTAITVMERQEGWNVCMEKARFEPFAKERDRNRILVHIITRVKKIALRTPYPEVAREVCLLMDLLPPMERPPVLVVDATGVGRPIVDMFRGVGLRPVAITITGGKQVVKHSSVELSIPKGTLFENVKALIQDGRLKVARGLPKDAEDDIKREMTAFGQKISEAGRETFDGVGEHDDVIMSIALAAWQAEHQPEPIRGADINLFEGGGSLFG